MSHQEYITLAEKAERAAKRASSKIARRFLAVAATEYRQQAAEFLKLEKP
jgi:hypothetical protein